MKWLYTDERLLLDSDRIDEWMDGLDGWMDGLDEWMFVTDIYIHV